MSTMTDAELRKRSMEVPGEAQGLVSEAKPRQGTEAEISRRLDPIDGFLEEMKAAQ